MGTLTLDTKDYVLTSLDAAFNDDVTACVCNRLAIHRGKYWGDPNLGSRLYLLLRSKDLPRVLLLAKQYAEEALVGLVPIRLQSVAVTVSQSVPSRLDLNIAITRLTGQKQNILYSVQVGG